MRTTLRILKIRTGSATVLIATFLSLLSDTGVGLASGSESVHGVVRDAVTKEAMPFAIVQVLETNRGTQTDSEGKFLIDNLAPGTYRVQASILGHNSQMKTDVIVAPGH